MPAATLATRLHRRLLRRVRTYAAGGVDVFDSWAGLTTSSPVLESALGGVGAASSVSISGNLTGIVSPIPADTVVSVFARTRYGGIATQTLDAGQTASFTITPQWYGPAARDITVRALARTGATGYPVAFVGFVEGTASVTSGQNATLDLDLSPVATTTISGSIAPDATGMLAGGMRFGSARTGGAAITFDAPAATPFTILVPAVRTTAILSAYRTYPSGASSWDVLPELASDQPHAFVHLGEVSLLAPAAGATFTPGMTFSWAPPPGATGGVYQLRLARSTSTPSPIFQHTTTATSVSIPAEFLPAPGATYVWRVAYFPRATSVDALTTDDGTLWASRITSVQRTITIP